MDKTCSPCFHQFLLKELSGLNINDERKLLEEKSKDQLELVPILSRFGVIRSGSSESLTYGSFYEYLPNDLKASYIAQVLKQNTIETTLRETIGAMNDTESTYSIDYNFNNLKMTVLSTESLKTYIKDEDYLAEDLELHSLTLQIRRKSINDLFKIFSKFKKSCC